MMQRNKHSKFEIVGLSEPACGEIEGRSFCQIKLALEERGKELACLNELSLLIDSYPGSPNKICQGAVDLLPKSWQYPDVCCGRIQVEEEAYQSKNFKETIWKQSAPIFVEGIQSGNIEVYYLTSKPTLDEGPFLAEERRLIDTIASMIGRSIDRFRTHKLLETKQAALESSKTALTEILSQMQDEKKAVVSNIETNVNDVIMPILDALASQSSESTQSYINLLRFHFQEITSPYMRKSSMSLSNLSPAELHICNLIQGGFSTKKIANFRKVSPATISRQRESIRRKLGLVNGGANLSSYLTALTDD